MLVGRYVNDSGKREFQRKRPSGSSIVRKKPRKITGVTGFRVLELTRFF